MRKKKVFILRLYQPDKSEQGDGEEEHQDVDVDVVLAMQLVDAGGREQDVDGESAHLGHTDQHVHCSLQGSR